MSKKRNEAVSTTETRCPKCGLGLTNLTTHATPVSSSWTADQMHNDADKKYICQDN